MLALIRGKFIITGMNSRPLWQERMSLFEMEKLIRMRLVWEIWQFSSTLNVQRKAFQRFFLLLLLPLQHGFNVLLYIWIAYHQHRYLFCWSAFGLNIHSFNVTSLIISNAWLLPQKKNQNRLLHTTFPWTISLAL